MMSSLTKYTDNKVIMENCHAFGNWGGNPEEVSYVQKLHRIKKFLDLILSNDKFQKITTGDSIQIKRRDLYRY